jgi:hypothetical protein
MSKSMKVIHVTVALYIKEEANIEEIIQEMEYNFKHENNIINMELIECEENPNA